MVECRGTGMSADPTNAISDAARRPLKSRQTRWAARLSAWLARRNISPNSISLASIAFAGLAAGGYAGCIFVDSPLGVASLLVVASIGIQLRLLCNLLDGMVAVEGGKGSKAGEIYNDAPDRVADAMILAAAGYATAHPYGPVLGWLAVTVALLTAYVRVLGRSLGAGVYFIGPMAKQHRMATLTLANLLGAAMTPWSWQRWPLLAALAIIVVGGAITAVRRLRRIARDLGSGP